MIKEAVVGQLRRTVCFGLKFRAKSRVRRLVRAEGRGSLFFFGCGVEASHVCEDRFDYEVCRLSILRAHGKISRMTYLRK